MADLDAFLKDCGVLAGDHLNTLEAVTRARSLASHSPTGEDLKTAQDVDWLIGAIRSESSPARDISRVSPAQLAAWGATDKPRFFAALKPGAVESERRDGVPWQVTLAQAALESGWGSSPVALGGYNLFGVKGEGPAGTMANMPTKEWIGGRFGRFNRTRADFAKYHDFHEAIVEHGRVFRKRDYTNALTTFRQDRSPSNFARNIQGIYASDPSYASMLISTMRGHGLLRGVED